MALKVIKYDSFYRGDTPNFYYKFTQPYVGYSWTGVTIDCVLTSATAPTDNVSAAASRLAQTLTVDASNTASYSFQLTATESKALTPGTKYTVQCQLKESGGTYVTTPVTGTVTVAQDYII